MRLHVAVRAILFAVGLLTSGLSVARAQDAAPPHSPPDYFAESSDDFQWTAAEAEAAGECSCETCQAQKAAAAAKKKADLKKAVAGAYAGVFYNNNFNYLCNPLYEDWHFGERLKRNCLGDCWVYDLGGQYRARYQGERNHRGFGLTGVDDDFLLHRTRLFANLEYGDDFRVYGEFIDAESNYENFTPRGIEVNRADMLNLFADAKVYDGTRGDLKVRVGRQELQYGSERLVSPLDWGNTRRTFEGAKFLWKGEDWNIDAFYTRPVIVNPHHFDSADYNQEFMGVWATYKAIKNNTLDFYSLQYNNSRLPNAYNFTTLGSRWLGSEDAWLWDFEGGYQFGDNTNGSSHYAGFATAGVGHKFEDYAWKPTLWGYYDWANGNNNRGAGNGFNHLFPLAHRYLGFMDLFGRSNIETPNVLLTMQPREKLKLLVWYYYFFLENKRDTPYNINMSAFNKPNAPVSADLGQEIDLLATYSLNPRMDIVLGYSHFFAGQYYKTTPGVPFRGDADFFYAQYQWNF